MRIITLLVLAVLVGGCDDSDCLPEPTGPDETPPSLSVTVEYVAPSGNRRVLLHEAGDEPLTITVPADAGLQIRYHSEDQEGLRSLHPSLTIQHTVGIGVERRSIDIPAITAHCPRLELSYRHDLPGTGQERTLAVTGVSENWNGTRTVLGPVTLHLQ